MIDYRAFQATSKSADSDLKNSYFYKHIPIKATYGIHEKTEEIIKSLNLDKSIKVLILGSGYGSFDLRILDLGFKNLTSVDFNDNYLLKNRCNFILRDLNKDFFDLGEYDLVICLEIIEHLENHAHFLRNISKLLAKDGNVIISSPNVENSLGRFKYFFIKTLPYFDDLEMKKNIHISPIFERFFLFHLENSGLELKKRFLNRNIWKAQFSNSFLRKILALLLFLITRFIIKKDNEGEMNIYLIGKK